MDDVLTAAASLLAVGELRSAHALLLDRRQADNPALLAALAGVEIKLGQHTDALETLDRAIAVAPENGRLYGLRGVALQTSGALNASILAYEKARQLLPDWNMLSSRLAALYVITDRARQGEQLARQALRTNSRNLTAIAALVESASRQRGEEHGSQVTRILHPPVLRAPSRSSNAPEITILRGIGANRLCLSAVGLPVPLDGHINIDERLAGYDVTQIWVDSPNLSTAMPTKQLIVNAMADADLLRRPLETAAHLLRQSLDGVINSPKHVLLTGRDDVCRLLQGIDGLTVPTTIRISGATEKDRVDGVCNEVEAGTLELPVLLRPAGSHNGDDTHIVDVKELIPRTVHRLQGSLYATQLHDTRGTDGMFRKTRLFCIGRQWFVEHHFVSESWCVHAKGWVQQMHRRPRLVDEARAAMTCTLLPNDRRLKAIADRLQLDVFGIDLYRQPNGHLVLFEANACMRLSTEEQIPQLGDHMQGAIRNIRKALSSFLEARARKLGSQRAC